MLKGAMVVSILICLSSCQSMSPLEQPLALPAKIDHIVYATPDLDQGIREIEDKLGVKATLGGQHPGRGTRNALISLGPSTYLEIFAPDPSQPAPKQPRAFGLDSLKNSKLVAWYVKSDDIERTRDEAVRAGVPLGQIRSGSRRRGDGVELSWKFTDPLAVVADGIVPLFIDWGRSPNPAITAPQGASLVALHAEHPDAPQVRHILQKLGVGLTVDHGSAPALIAVIDCPKGRVVLR